MFKQAVDSIFSDGLISETIVSTIADGVIIAIESPENTSMIEFIIDQSLKFSKAIINFQDAFKTIDVTKKINIDLVENEYLHRFYQHGGITSFDSYEDAHGLVSQSYYLQQNSSIQDTIIAILRKYENVNSCYDNYNYTFLGYEPPEKCLDRKYGFYEIVKFVEYQKNVNIKDTAKLCSEYKVQMETYW